MVSLQKIEDTMIQVSTGQGGVSIKCGWSVVGMSRFSERAERIAREFDRVGMLHCEWRNAEHLMSDPTIDDGIKRDILDALQ